ncbi:MAG: hypothetical protein NW207_05115 [Cytophagales bacterium]|nr:hypothetical protein [Cytophagales bacterium]
MCALSLFACTQKRNVDDRVFVEVITHNSAGAPIDYCFDEIKGLGISAYKSACTEGTAHNLLLPFNTGADSTTYLFKKSSKTDTLHFIYKRTVIGTDENYSMLFDLVQLKNTDTNKFKPYINSIKWPCFYPDTFYCGDKFTKSEKYFRVKYYL